MTLQQLAGYLFPWHSPRLEMLVLNARLGACTRRFRRLPDRGNREAYFRHLNESHLRQRAIDYLEFGVFQGESVRQWLQINSHPQSRFFGFDTFEGLPEDWRWFRGGLQKGDLSTQGRPPDISDPRVTFVKGIFQETLGVFLTTFEPRFPLVVHIDSDLYSACLYVLTRLDPLIHNGGLVLFDEFNSPLHEFRALQDYLGAYGRSATMVARNGPMFQQAAFVISGSHEESRGN